MQLANQLELCLHKQTQIVASAACRVGSQEFHSWIASLPLVSLLFIVIPTPFLNFLLSFGRFFLNGKLNKKRPNDNKYNSGLCVFVPTFAYLSQQYK